MPRAIGKPFLRPKLILTYPRNLSKSTLTAVYSSFSNWQEALYPKVISQTPTSKNPTGRFPSGFVRNHIKLVTRTGEEGLKYKVISVPGGTVRGTPAFHALSAINSYHGESGRPLTITPKAGSFLTFPLKKGQSFRNPKMARRAPGQTAGPKNWVVTKKVYQAKWGKQNPWVFRIFEANKKEIIRILHKEMSVKSKRGRETRIEVS